MDRTGTRVGLDRRDRGLVAEGWRGWVVRTGQGKKSNGDPVAGGGRRWGGGQDRDRGLVARGWRWGQDRERDPVAGRWEGVRGTGQDRDRSPMPGG